MRLVLRRLPVVGLILLCSFVGGCAAPRREVPAPRAAVAAAAVLRVWDARRAEAWASGSVSDLRALYVPGSATGAADVRMLRAWRARGLVVADLRTQLLAVEVLEHAPGRLRLRVTDRVVAAEATGPGLRLPLPRDGASTYVIVLQRYDEVWRVRETTAA